MDEKTVKLTAKLYECRDAARTLLGASYFEHMREYAKVIDDCAVHDNCSFLSAAIRLAKQTQAPTSVFLLAAVVEHSEPSNAEASA